MQQKQDHGSSAVRRRRKGFMTRMEWMAKSFECCQAKGTKKQHIFFRGVDRRKKIGIYCDIISCEMKSNISRGKLDIAKMTGIVSQTWRDMAGQ